MEVFALDPLSLSADVFWSWSPAAKYPGFKADLADLPDCLRFHAFINGKLVCPFWDHVTVIMDRTVRERLSISRTSVIIYRPWSEVNQFVFLTLQAMARLMVWVDLIGYFVH